ncbi:addiction module protein [Dyadobacter sp. CY323]|uniref:addiction module protein n=1 Tax=Dyadobacter sp. CY323 TaxID=2907302 RepID=UPI001F1E4AC4|nr:addiction module protein [Dyadobacter sp. CY323]MCE6992228.1 addiction module protein [Dyadobacter sp. CY323]
MAATYHIRIKKDYAAALIEDLQKVDAVELIEVDNGDDFEIPLWQKETVLNRLKDAKEHPEKLISWDEAKLRINKLGN